MKKLIVAFVAILALALPAQMNAQNDAISKYFEKYMDNEDFTVVYISGKMFEMFAKIAPDDEDMADIKEVIQDLKGLRILVNENDGQKFYKEAMSKINTSEYEELMTVRSDGDNVKFLVKEQGGVIQELLLMVGGDEFVMMSFVGKINLEKIGKLMENVDIDVDGAEHLKHLNKDKKE